jgi:excisionase family DNA binding protein
MMVYLLWHFAYAEMSTGGKKMADANLDKWINIDKAAEYLGVKPGTIRGWIRNNKGVPAHKIGKQWKFKCSELDAWVKSGKSAIN